MLYRFALIIIALMALPAYAERHALVIGINSYENIGELQTAVNDARAVAASLERSGFTVDLGVDVTRSEFVRLMAQFTNRLDESDEALIFYAGHAVAIGSRNILLPADVSALQQSSEMMIAAEGLGQDFILEQVAATGARLTVMIMDACRNNPFEGVTDRSLGRTRGLAIEQPPRGVFMMFSADEGQTALDGLGRGDNDPNSVFTRTLLPLLEEPGLDIVDIARRLRGNVEQLAASVNHQQFPVYRDRMQGDGTFIFRPEEVHTQDTQPPPSLLNDETPQAEDSCITALPLWSAIQETTSAAVLRSFVDSYNYSCPTLSALASERINVLTEVVASELQESVPVQDDSEITALANCDLPHDAVAQLLRGNASYRIFERFISEYESCSLFVEYAQSSLRALQAQPDAENIGETISRGNSVTEMGLGLTRQERMEIQMMLNSLGYNCGEADGIFGQNTRTAIREFAQFSTGHNADYLSEGLLFHLTTIFNLAPEVIDGVWSFTFMRTGDADWLRANAPENWTLNMRNRALSILNVRIEQGEIVSTSVSSVNSDIPEGILHSISLSQSGILSLDYTSYYRQSSSSSKRIQIDIQIPDRMLSRRSSVYDLGSYGEGYNASVHVMRRYLEDFD